MKKPVERQYDADGNPILTKEDEIIAKFSTNRTFLKFFLGSIKFLFKVFSLPGIRKNHPWVSEKYTYSAVLPINEELTVDNVLLPYPIINEIIDRSSHRMIMNVCGCRLTYDCQNHPIDIGCINMGESVLDLSPALGRLASKEEAKAHAKKAIDNGLVPFIGKGRLDNALYMIPDKGKLLGLCFCCHCCCITDAFANLPADHFKRLFPDYEGIKMEITDDCTACGSCIDYCLYNAITIENSKAVQNDMCVQCGRCATNCPSQAIKMSLSDTKFMDEILKKIDTYVDLS